jgi:hypothetical protein
VVRCTPGLDTRQAHPDPSLPVSDSRIFAAPNGENGECREPLRLTREERESVRGESTHFAVAIDHEKLEIAPLVSEHER